MEERSPVVDVHAHFVRGIWPFWVQLDRKSTRLNSSHLVISYAVFCLKKKKRDSEHTKYQRGATRRIRHGANDTHPRQCTLYSRTHDTMPASFVPRFPAHHGRH